MNNLIEQLKGYKTYIVASLAVIYALTGLLSGQLTVTQAVAYILSSGGLAALRGAIAKVQVYLPLIEQIWVALHTQQTITATPVPDPNAPQVQTPPQTV